VLLVCATFPLIWVGGLVTSYEAGMAVEDWPGTFGQNLFLYPLSDWLAGPRDLFVEHGHRLLGSLVGLLSIVLAVTLWRQDDRRWIRWLGLAVVVAVIGQGILGGMRVVLDERTLARIHGCTGPAFFLLCVAVAVMTSRRWRETQTPRSHPGAARLKLMATVTTVLAYAQLVAGSFVRHVPLDGDGRIFQVAVAFHLVLAVVLTFYISLLGSRIFRQYAQQRDLRRPAAALVAMICLQLALGVSTWVLNYGWPAWFDGYAWAAQHRIIAESPLQIHTTTAHVALGSLIAATSLVLALRSHRLLATGVVRAGAGLSLLFSGAMVTSSALAEVSR
jgi:cytochrome c oxidase assembly protein subunit 15